MKAETAIKRLTKAGYQVLDTGGRITAHKGEFQIYCLRNGGLDSICTIGTNDSNDRLNHDPRIDYFTNTYWPNLKQAIDYTENRIKRSN